MSLRPPKGTRDLDPKDVIIRENLFKKIKCHFELYGCLPIDTPVIECMETVKNLYGDEFNKSVYTIDDKKDDDGDSDGRLILRYDLTVPCARYVISNGLVNFKRYQIGKVYRRDTPQISKGRFREFYQCDADFIGQDYGSMIQDAEMLSLLNVILQDIIGVGTFIIRLNSKKVLYNVLAFCGFNEKDFCTVCSSLDKLDKVSWTLVCQELINKGLSVELAMKLQEFVELVKNGVALEQLMEKGYLSMKTYDELVLLFNNLKVLGISSSIRFDPLLSRGLDYYTGIIFEAEYLNKNIMPSSIAAGGRYDGMLDKLGTKGIIPAIGLSIGIERIVVILESTMPPVELAIPKAFIATVGKGMEIHKLKLACELREKGILVDYFYNKEPKMRQQLDYVFEKKIPFMIVIGGNEIENGTVNLKYIAENKQVSMKRSDLSDILLSN